jgi:hypothetical protein
MADEVRLEVVSTANNKGLTDAARDMKGLRSEADKLTGTLGELEDGSFSLDKAIEETREEVVQLRQELARTGDMTLFGDLRRQQTTLSNLEKIKEALEEVAEASAEVGSAAAVGGIGAGGAQFGSSFGSSASRGIGPAIATGIIAALVPLAPAIGATVAGAVAGTIGTGGIAGGIAMASKDARVKASAAAFGAAISQEFFRGGEVFVGPTQEALKILLRGFKDMQLPESFAKMAPHVTTIATGFADMGRNIMPGLNKAFDRMGPLADEAADGLASTGDALSDFMDSVTASEGTREGLRTFFFLLNGTIRGVGDTLEWLGNRYDEALRFTDGFAMAFEDLPGMLGVAARQARENIAVITADAPHFAAKAIEATDRVTTSNAETAQSWVLIRDRIEAATRAQDAYFNAAMAVPAANDAFQESIDSFNESLKENGRTFDSNTEKGRANREAMRDLVQGAQDIRSAMIESGQSVADADRKYLENIATIERMAAAAGVNRQELLKMAGDYFINIYRRELTNKVTFFSSNAATFDSRRGFASGGTTPAFEAFRVHEGEVMFSDRQHYVATKEKVDQMSRPGGAGGTMVYVVELRLNGEQIQRISLDYGLARGIPESTLAQAYP